MKQSAASSRSARISLALLALWVCSGAAAAPLAFQFEAHPVHPVMLRSALPSATAASGTSLESPAAAARLDKTSPSEASSRPFSDHLTHLGLHRLSDPKYHAQLTQLSERALWMEYVHLLGQSNGLKVRVQGKKERVEALYAAWLALRVQQQMQPGLQRARTALDRAGVDPARGQPRSP